MYPQKQEPNPSEIRGEEMAERFTKNLLVNDEAMAYLKDRGVSKSWIEAGYLGICPPYSDHWFPLLRGRITVPIRDVHGRIIAFAGRQFEPLVAMTERALWESFGHKPEDAQKRIDKWKRAKWVNESFPKGRHLYMLDHAKEYARSENYLVMMEGYLDAFSFVQRGIGNATALCGTALTEFHAALISRYCAHGIILMDGDSAGAMAAEKSAAILLDAKIQPHLMHMPSGYDPDEYIVRVGGQFMKERLDRVIDENILNYQLPTLKIV